MCNPCGRLIPVQVMKYRACMTMCMSNDNNEYSLIIFFNYILTLMLKLSHPPLEPDILIYNKRRIFLN